MTREPRTYAWALVFAVLLALAVPWFMWGDATVVAGLPAWLWWHIGWMLLAAVVFAAFARTAWDDAVGTGVSRRG